LAPASQTISACYMQDTVEDAVKDIVKDAVIVVQRNTLQWYILRKDDDDWVNKCVTSETHYFIRHYLF